MTKYIHYCWFGDKKLPKLAKKCIKSWQKYLPDFEIIKWSEDNVNLDECPFIRGAYDNKKWAFVADYARCKALKEMGGIYFDTDMEITKDISDLLENETFLGIEDTGYVAVGVWHEKHKNAYLPTELLKKYKSFKEFDINRMVEFSIPKLISGLLDKYGLIKGDTEIQTIKDSIVIYPRDYFYPYSYNRENNIFTDNTRMIHYYDASWIPLKDRIENNMVRNLGKKNTYRILNTYRRAKNVTRKVGKMILFPVVIYRRKKRAITNSQEYINRINDTINSINKLKDGTEYVAFYNKYWLGVTSATTELFDSMVDLGEIHSQKDIKRIGDSIISKNIKQIVFSSFAIGWKDLTEYLKSMKPSIKIKSFWHGSHSQILDGYGWARNIEIIKLHKEKKIDVMGTCKKSLLNFYKSEGYNASFITNKVTTEKEKNNHKDNKKIKIGIYAAKCDDWRKNMYTQLAAVSLIENAIIDMVPLNETAVNFCKSLGVEIEGEWNSLPREKLLKRISKNNLNLYITYSECAPMLPLESMEKGVVCISGNNHHYFQNSELEKYIIVNDETDVIEIKEKIINAIKNEKKILKLYDSFSSNNKNEAKNELKEFLEK